ncbi:MAG: flagellar biosynthetic protein FliR [Verrucomicrobiota bacterium]
MDPIAFWLVAARLSGLFAAVPGVSDFSIPTVVKAGLLIWLTFFLTPLTPAANYAISGVVGLVFIGMGELVIGAGLGLVVKMCMVVMQFAGMLVDNELGLTAAEQLNPAVTISGGVFGRVFVIAGMVYFWVLDYFTLVLMGLVKSFEIIPMAHFISNIGIKTLVNVGSSILISGFAIAIPILAVSFMTTFALGLISKAVQGLNIMFLSFTIRLGVGLAAVIVFLPLLLFMIRKQLGTILPRITDYMVELNKLT